MKYYDLCIIGGGASGLAAASSLDDSIKTCVLEKNDIPGRKLMATGGGRCNITNEACRNKEMTLEFFDSMGLALYHDDEGRYYPYSNQASDVVKMLERSVRGKVDVYKRQILRLSQGLMKERYARLERQIDRRKS